MIPTKGTHHSPSAGWGGWRIGSAAIVVAILLLTACSNEGSGAAGLGGTRDATGSTAPATSVAESPSEPSATPMPDEGPFTSNDLERLVLAPEEGDGLVPGLAYSSSYSGAAYLGDIHHWTLVPTEPLEEAGFVEAYSAMFMTPAFPSTFGMDGRDLATAALLFRTTAGAREGLQVFADTRDEVWDEWRPLHMRHGNGQVGLLGSDNVSVVYPTVGFTARVANVILLLGSQGGSDEGQPLPENLMRRIAYDLRNRARAVLEI